MSACTALRQKAAVKTCRKYWGRAIRDAIVQLPHIVFDNPQFSLTTTFSKEDFIRILQERPGVTAATVNEFFATVDAMNFYDDRSLTTRALFTRFPGRTDIHRLLMEPITYANGFTLDEPAITYGIVFSNFMNRGVYLRGRHGPIDRPDGRGTARQGGAHPHWCSRVFTLVENGRVCGAQVGGRRIGVNAVVSNAGINNTVTKSAGRERFSPTGEFNAVRVNKLSCQVYFGIRRGEPIPEIGDLLFTSHRSRVLLGRDAAHGHPQPHLFGLLPQTRPEAEPDHHRRLDERQLRRLGRARRGVLPAAKTALVERELHDLERYVPGARQVRTRSRRPRRAPFSATPCIPAAPASAPSSRGWTSPAPCTGRSRGCSTWARWASS